jgi:uncharacterized protein YkwD
MHDCQNFHGLKQSYVPQSQKVAGINHRRRNRYRKKKIVKVITVAAMIVLAIGLFAYFIVPQLEVLSAGTTINSSWVVSFISNVNAYREQQGEVSLTLSSQLGSFSQIRFTTMTAGTNYEISHYGFDSDAASFFGSAYSLGEVVYYPSGFSPSDYTANIKSNAPAHWSLMMKPNLLSYGYYIGQGPVYELDQGCTATEIPGPNINESLFFHQNGCAYSIGTGTWLVIDFSS